MVKNITLYKAVDGKKIKKYFAEHPELTKSGVCKDAQVNRGVITDAQARNLTRIVFWNAICDVLKVPKDYFDLVEPVVTEKEPEERETECGIDLADIQLSLNKIEALLLEQNKLLNTAINKHIVVKSSPAQAWDRLTNK